MRAAAWPMAPSEFDRLMAGVLDAAELDQLTGLFAAGHEVAALMEPGGAIKTGSGWTVIGSVSTADSGYRRIRTIDGQDLLAHPGATRRYRAYDADVAARLEQALAGTGS